MCAAICAVLLAIPSSSFAAAGIILAEPLHSGVGSITDSGHSAIYLSRVCPETPVKLRLCNSGESGSILSNYSAMGEDQPFEWNVVPLSIYLYGVENPANRPVFGTEAIQRFLENRYRESYLAAYCESSSCQEDLNAEWRDMVATTLSRGVYIFVVDTTLQQDEAFIAAFNSRPNRNHFNGVTRNCATFVKYAMNFYFPHSVHADYINDFGMTSPKAAARSFSRYALHHPDLNYRVLHFSQIPGTAPRSPDCRDGIEQLYHSKRFLIPMAVVASHTLAAVTAYSLLTARFNPYKKWEAHPGANPFDGAQEQSPLLLSRSEIQDDRTLLKEDESPRDSGQNPAASKYSRDVFRSLETEGTPIMDEDGALWEDVAVHGSHSRVGISASSLLETESDRDIATKLSTARISYFLHCPPRGRETASQFSQDSAELSFLKTNTATISAGVHTAASGSD